MSINILLLKLFLVAPEIEEAPSWIHTTEGLTVQMKCVIQGEPEPRVSCYFNHISVSQ